MKTNIRKAYIFNFFSSLHFIGGVLIPFFTDWGKISFLEIMILQSWFVFSVFLLEVPTGAVADFWGRKTSLVLAAFVEIAGFLVYTSRPDFLVFLLGEFLLALGVALSSGAYEALIYDSLKEAGRETESKKTFGRLESLSMAGLMLGAPIGSLIAVLLGLRWTMLLMVVPFSVAGLVALTFKEPKIKKKEESTRYLQVLAGGVKYFYSHKVLRVLALDGVIVDVLVWFLIWTYQLVLKELNVNLAYFGIVHAGITVTQIIVMNNFERLEKVFGSKRRYLFFSAAISGLAFIVLGVNAYIVPAITAMVIISGFGLSRLVLVSNYMQKHIESHNRATVLSAVSMFRRLGMAFAYPLVGLSVGISLNYTLVVIGLLIIGFALIPKTKEAHLLD